MLKNLVKMVMLVVIGIALFIFGLDSGFDKGYEAGNREGYEAGVAYEKNRIEEEAYDSVGSFGTYYGYDGIKIEYSITKTKNN